MTVSALNQRPLYEDVAERLRQQIFERTLEPGSWIDEIRIAESLGISRTPLREALKVLATEGLVTMKLRRGAYVTEVNEKDLMDVYHLLSLLESDAARAVASQASDQQLQELAQLHDQLAQNIEHTEAFFSINEQFHLRLLEMANNRWRLNMVNDLRKVMKLNRHHSLLKEGRIDQSLKEHEGLVQALLDRNPELAAQRMATHFANGLQAAA
ncbi:MAG: hypothetical protein RL111_1466 [Pseudomonadota bacterium]|jgi:DNA-binding GntR family transcriptional regulator